MATMNPLELYHDPALDNLIQQANPTIRNSSSNNRHAKVVSRSMSDDYGRMQQPYGNTARGAPISYGRVGPNPDPALHRSFSQRAKGRPFADEAFMDDDLAERRQSSSRSSVPVPADRPSNDEQPSAQIPAPQQIPPVSKREGPSQKSGHRRHDSATSAKGIEPRTKDTTHRQSRTLSIGTGGSRSQEQPTQANGQSDKWAHDRSPLQKLEVKLTDISKEEKRARVQEAELKYAREKKMGKEPEKPRRNGSLPAATAVRSNQTSVPKATRVREAETPTRRKDTLHNQPMVSPQVARKPISTSQPASRGVQSSDSYQKPKPTVGQRPTSDRELIDAAPQVARAVSLQHQKPRIRYQHEDGPVTQRERNASHQAALDQLTGARSTKQRSASNPAVKAAPVAKKIAEEDTGSLGSPIGVDLSSLAGEAPGFTPNQQVTSRQTMSKQAPIGVPGNGLGLQNPTALRSVDSPPASLKEVNKQRQRKSSVSFKEPFDRRRPVDEWKGAVTAILNLDDFKLDDVQAKPNNSDTEDLNTTWWEKSPSQAQRASRGRESTTTTSQPIQVIDDRTAQFNPRLQIRCGPLLRYCGLRRAKDEASSGKGERQFWRGSLMIVTQDSLCSYEEFPTLRIFSQPKKLLPPPPALVQGDQLAPEYVDPIAGLTKMGRTGKALYVRPVDHLDVEKDVSRIEDDNGIYESAPSPLDGASGKDATSASTNKRTSDQDGERLGRYKEVKGVRIYADPDRDVTFWRFNLEVELGPTQQHIGYRINKGAAMGFWVPAKGQSMNIMFHSCNGFSMSVNPDEFSGPDPLWRDVLNNHQTRPFHVMIGGGDQVYNDRVTADTHWFSGWTKIKNPHAKHQAPFTNEMKEELESFYLDRYCMWFSQGLFALAGSSIPMINVWDDHDIIDGFGSYPHDFMKTPVFSGLGNIAYKYYMLFQHQSIDAMTEKDEPSWLLGHAPGPYIHTKSRSVFLELGQHIAFLGIDCRTERTKNEVMSIDTLELILDRCRRDVIEGRTKHLIILLGVPIAYPRLVWLENVLTSRAIEPLKALGRAGILKPGLLNKFDGGVEILDDLDDHWTATHHKDERNVLIQELQDLAAEKSTRITILSGDVHLAAIGQFYSNPKLKIPKDKDHRYMPNIISSAIVNTPPPDMMADVLNKRNKIHHLDKYTDENMIPMFTHDVDRSKRNNTRLLPRRNWCSIREYHPGETPPPSPSLHSVMTDDDQPLPEMGEDDWAMGPPPKRRLSLGKSDLNPMNLMRRLSSRRAPPSAYPNENLRPQQSRSASFDGTASRGQHSQHQNFAQSPKLRAASADHISDAKALRPSFHRRPTNLSEKAARKGIVSAVDAEGNEIEVNDHINLEGGLDVVINCEVDKKDPAGITLPYRFLVPSLWYDGSSDREKLDEVVKPTRKATVLNKFGLGARPAHRVADPQVGRDLDDSFSEEEDYNEDMIKKKSFPSFSLFGSRRRKTYAKPADEFEDMDSMDERNPGENSHEATRQPVIQPSSQRLPPESAAPHQNQQAVLPPTVQQQPYPPPAPMNQSQAGEPKERKINRPLSFTMGKKNSIPNQIPSLSPQEQFFASKPFDADASYVNGQHQHVNNTDHADYGHQSTTLRRGPSKQERVLGIGAASDNYLNPNQTQLRGNGILGKNMPPTSFRSDHKSHRPRSSSSDSAVTRGYSGIDAYRDPKPQRRWSLGLRDRARGFMGSIDGRNKRRGDLYSDDDEEEYWEGPKQQYHEQAAPPQRQVQQPPIRQSSQRSQNAGRERSYRQWGPVYSYDKGRVFSYDQPQQRR